MAANESTFRHQPCVFFAYFTNKSIGHAIKVKVPGVIVKRFVFKKISTVRRHSRSFTLELWVHNISGRWIFGKVSGQLSYKKGIQKVETRSGNEAVTEGKN